MSRSSILHVQMQKACKIFASRHGPGRYGAPCNCRGACRTHDVLIGRAGTTISTVGCQQRRARVRPDAMHCQAEKGIVWSPRSQGHALLLTSLE